MVVEIPGTGPDDNSTTNTKVWRYIFYLFEISAKRMGRAKKPDPNL